MSASTFDGALARVLAREGGFTDNPRDPGGATNFGITIADYRRYVKPDATPADVRAMRVGDAQKIYRTHYWDALDCDALPAGIDESVFDYGVNSGIGRAGKVLRRVLNLADNDWRVTERVVAACASRDAATVVNAICDERLRFLQSLKTWPAFGKGWQRRVAEVRASALALAAASARSVREDVPGRALDASQPAVKPAVVAAGAAGGFGLGALVPFAGSHPVLTAMAMMAIVLAAVAAVMGWHRLHRPGASRASQIPAE